MGQAPRSVQTHWRGWWYILRERLLKLKLDGTTPESGVEGHCRQVPEGPGGQGVRAVSRPRGQSALLLWRETCVLIALWPLLVSGCAAAWGSQPGIIDGAEGPWRVCRAASRALTPSIYNHDRETLSFLCADFRQSYTSATWVGNHRWRVETVPQLLMPLWLKLLSFSVHSSKVDTSLFCFLFRF